MLDSRSPLLRFGTDRRARIGQEAFVDIQDSFVRTITYAVDVLKRVNTRALIKQNGNGGSQFPIQHSTNFVQVSPGFLHHTS